MRRLLLVSGLLLTLGTAAVNAQATLSEKSNEFAINFFEKVIGARKDSSVIVSPLGVNFVLGMLDSGASGQTAHEINSALGTNDAATLAEWHHSLITTLPTLDDKTELGIANAIVLNSAKGYSLLPAYAEQMQTQYEALIESKDFGDAATLDYINNWGKEQTRRMIPQVLRRLNPSMVSLLINALYFKGVWSKTFDPELTSRDCFLTADGKYEEVAMMHANDSYPYAAYDLYKTVRLDYGKGSYSMYVLLPEWGHTITEVLAAMKTSTLSGTGDWMQAPVMTDDVHLSLPQFSSESELSLVDILKACGVSAMFDPSCADFSGMSDLSDLDENLYVELFKQVAKIEVDENGTKAAAVTIGGMAETAIPNNEFNACRPFLYVIVENVSHTICFMGQFTGKGTDASARPINTGISAPAADKKSRNIYDLQGRRLEVTPKNGIYIVEGKKRMAK